MGLGPSQPREEERGCAGVGRSSWWGCWRRQRQGDRTQHAGQEREEVLKGRRNCYRELRLVGEAGALREGREGHSKQKEQRGQRQGRWPGTRGARGNGVEGAGVGG